MMGSFKPSYFQILYLLISALLECKAQTERPCKVHQLNINYLQGDNMSISCLTTTHPLESLRINLRRTESVQHILKYPDKSEHERWSVRNYAGNVTIYLKDIRSSDGNLYDCQVFNDSHCLKATQLNLTVIQCKRLAPVHATASTSVLLPCPEYPLQNKTNQVPWKILIGHKPADIAQYRPAHKPSNSTEKLQRPLYERVRILENGSLLIRDAVNTDESWYQCRTNKTTCYEVKLVMKDKEISHSTATLETLSRTCPTCHTADSPVVQTEGNIDASATVTTNLTAVVMVTIVSLCVLISLIICVIVYFKKRKSKSNSQTKLNGRFSVYYSPVAEGFDDPLYSLVEQNTGTMITFAAEQTEAPANIYDI